MAEASDAGGLKLLGFWGSPFSLEIQVALKLKGIPYDYQEEDLEQGKSEALLHSNPIYMAVPVLVHDGRPLAESLIILEYLDESFGGPPLLPSDPYSRSRARFWADFFYQKVVPALRAIIIKEGEEQEMVMKEARERLREFEQGSLELKREGPFFNGGSPGLLDIVLGSARCWIRVLEDLAGKELMSHETTPALCPIAEALADLPAFQEAAPQHQRLLAYALRLRSRARALLFR